MFRRIRPRRGARNAGIERDYIGKARTFAFDDMYRNYANPFVNHFLTPEDIEDVSQAVRPKVIALLRNQGVGFEWSHLDRIVQIGVEQASAAFLSI